MFIQVIQGKTSDPEGLGRQLDRWIEELAPGAVGVLGTTFGIAEDGTAVMVARFSSEEEARSNSDRAEQGEWWTETEKYFDGDVTFHDCSRVDLVLGEPSDDAGFVQVIQGKIIDRTAMEEIASKMDSLPKVRDDVIGGTFAWHNDGDGFTQTMYFTSEAEARAGEAKMDEQEPPEEMKRMRDAVTDLTFIDLKQPRLVTL